MISIEMASTYTPADGSAPRTIHIRVGDLRKEPDDEWSLAVDVLGFKTDDHVRIHGTDWLSAVEYTATFLRGLAGGKAADYGGKLEPKIDLPWQDFTRTLQMTPVGEGATRDIVVRVGHPSYDRSLSAFVVVVEIYGFEQPCSQQVQGVDQIQAFQEGCRVVPSLLASRVPAGARLHWRGGDDLGFGGLSPSFGGGGK